MASKKSSGSKKFVYFFGGGKADGNEKMKNLLGGKGANLAEMAGNPKLKLPVPPGFTLTTDVCTYYYENGKKYPKVLEAQVKAALEKVEKIMGKKFGDENDPLLMSVRSGARRSMPGMMETVLNVGLTTRTIPGLIKQTGGNERSFMTPHCHHDVQRCRHGKSSGNCFLTMGIRRQLERIMDEVKEKKGIRPIPT